jgi:hypothetical protein
VNQIPNTAFEDMMAIIQRFPLWIKMVIFTKLRGELENSTTKTLLNTFGTQDTLQLLVPKLTHVGIQELKQPSGQFSQGILKLLYFSYAEKTILNICLLNHWSLQECCKHLLEALQTQLLFPPNSTVMLATVHYIAAKIRLGEYLMQIGRITVEQLDQGLRTQQYISEALGEKTGLGDVLINLGYITKQDTEGILFLIEESKRTITVESASAQTLSALNATASSTGGSGDVNNAQFEQTQQYLRQAMQRIKQLEQENLALKQRIVQPSSVAP